MIPNLTAAAGPFVTAGGNSLDRVQLTLLTRARRIIIFEGVITVSQVSDKCRCRGALRRSSSGNKMGKNWQKH